MPIRRGTSGRTPGATVANTASAAVGRITHTGTAAGNYGVESFEKPRPGA